MKVGLPDAALADTPQPLSVVLSYRRLLLKLSKGVCVCVCACLVKRAAWQRTLEQAHNPVLSMTLGAQLSPVQTVAENRLVLEIWGV